SRVGKFHVDLERRNLGTTVDLHLHLFGVDADVPAHDRKDFLARQRNKSGLADDPPPLFEQDLEPLACDRGGVAPPREAEEPHAALRPNSRLNRPFRSVGMLISMSSPVRRSAAA